MAVQLVATLAVISFDLLLNLFYLIMTLRMYSRNRVSVGVLFALLFSTRILILIVQGFGLLLTPKREMLSDTVALGGIIVGLLYVLILENYWSPTYDSRRLSLIAALATLTSTFILLARNEVVGVALKKTFPFFIQLTVPIVFFFIAFSVYLLTKSMLQYASAVQRRALSLIRLNVLATYAGVPIYLMLFLLTTTTPEAPLPEYTPTNFLIFTTIPSSFYFVMDLIWYVAFVRYSSLSFLQISRIDRIIVTNEDGIALYEHSPIQDQGVDENLFSGALFAIQAVLREGAKISGDLKMIQIGDYYLLFRKSMRLSVILFTKQTSKFLDSVITFIAGRLSSSLDPESVSVDLGLVDDIVLSVLYSK